jgi:hypothetical protein
MTDMLSRAFGFTSDCIDVMFTVNCQSGTPCLARTHVCISFLELVTEGKVFVKE